MSNLEVLKDLETKGFLKPLITNGIVPVKVLSQMEIFYAVDAKVKVGVKKETAIRQVQCSMNVCRATVYNALKSLR